MGWKLLIMSKVYFHDKDNKSIQFQYVIDTWMNTYTPKESNKPSCDCLRVRLAVSSNTPEEYDIITFISPEAINKFMKEYKEWSELGD
tara:strand:+ start:362 stop:625 length:264 start_codon:yes stop_codon:yes gene_type:complete